MSHSWSSAPHWKCGIPTRVSRVRIPSSPPGIQKIQKSYIKSHKPASFWDFFGALLLWYVFTFRKSTILPTMTYFAQKLGVKNRRTHCYKEYCLELFKRCFMSKPLYFSHCLSVQLIKFPPIFRVFVAQILSLWCSIYVSCNFFNMGISGFS